MTLWTPAGTANVCSAPVGGKTSTTRAWAGGAGSVKAAATATIKVEKAPLTAAEGTYVFFLTLKLKVAGLRSVPAGPTASTENVCLPFFAL